MLATQAIAAPPPCQQLPVPGAIAAWTRVLQEQDARYALNALLAGQEYTKLPPDELAAVATLVAMFGPRPAELGDS